MSSRKRTTDVWLHLEEIKIINGGCITNNLINIFMDFYVLFYN